jgi:hypothetical protein
MSRTQAVYYRDERGVEPVDDFIEALPPKPSVDGHRARPVGTHRPDVAPLVERFIEMDKLAS